MDMSHQLWVSGIHMALVSAKMWILGKEVRAIRVLSPGGGECNGATVLTVPPFLCVCSYQAD